MSMPIFFLECLGDPCAVLVIDETSVRKRGKKSAGVSKQHCGITGQLENCQVGVFLAYVSRFGHTLIDRELYLPLLTQLAQDGARFVSTSQHRASHWQIQRAGERGYPGGCDADQR
jgi:SRSO17 transposase